MFKKFISSDFIWENKNKFISCILFCNLNVNRFIISLCFWLFLLFCFGLWLCFLCFFINLFLTFLFFFLILWLLFLCISLLQYLNNLQHNGLIRSNLLTNLIDNFNNFIIFGLRSQHHNITSRTINQFVISWFYICHNIALVTTHTTHY